MQQATLYNKIFDKTQNDWDTNSFLKNIVEEYPYFGVAHFFNLKNTSSTKNSYKDVATKTALFFNSPFLLQLHLNSKEEINTILSQNKVDDKENITPIILEKNIIPNELISNPINILQQVEKVKEAPLENNIATTEINIAFAKEGKIIANKTAPPVAKDEMLFEPLFTSDYFASQGIKLSEAILADDKLGKQLKSFTSWLKTMKKVHPDKLPMVNAILEAKVQSQAAKSNIEEEVITEPMAEAFALQGKEIRAIEVYEKLSLLNPIKSAYFATKIEQLKK